MLECHAEARGGMREYHVAHLIGERAVLAHVLVLPPAHVRTTPLISPLAVPLQV